jgi:hypothetical protein
MQLSCLALRCSPRRQADAAPGCCCTLQRLDHACSRVTDASIVLQLLGVLWRLLGQLVAAEALVFVIARPKLLQRLHSLLATGAVSLSAVLQKLGLISSRLLPGEPRHLAVLAVLCRYSQFVPPPPPPTLLAGCSGCRPL